MTLYCPKCGKELFVEDGERLSECPFCHKSFANEQPKPGSNEQPKTERLVSKVPRHQSEDIKFETPEHLLAWKSYGSIIVWIIGIVMAISALWAMFTESVLGGVLGLVHAAVFVAFGLVALRIMYEMVVVFFEQLRVTKQIRDRLFEKLDSRA